MASKRTCHGGGAADIADDVLREAFTRLPGLLELLRCGATCKHWRRLVTDRAFLRRLGHWPDTAHRPSILAGIFSQNVYSNGPRRMLGKKKPFYTPPGFLSLQAGGGTRLTFDSAVAFDDDDALFDLARPLASRRSYLLVRVLLPGHNYYGRNLHLAVCRPLIDKRSTRLLPPPPFNPAVDFRESGVIGCAILAGGDHEGGKQEQPMLAFQVILIYEDSNRFVCACTYSSDTASWSAPVEYCWATRFVMCGPQAGVVTGGTVHWLFMDLTYPIYCTLNINIATSRVSLTEIPIKVDARPPIPCIAGEEGKLSFVTIQGHGVAEIWTKQEQYEDVDAQEHGREYNGVWRCSRLADLGSERIDRVFFAETRGALLVEQGGTFSMVDLKSKERTSVHLKEEGTGHVSGTHCLGACSSSCCSGGHPGLMCRQTPLVLYEMNWVFSRHIVP